MIKLRHTGADQGPACRKGQCSVKRSVLVQGEMDGSIAVRVLEGDSIVPIPVVELGEEGSTKWYIKKVTTTTEETDYDTIEARNDALTDGTTYVNTITGTAGQPSSIVTVYSEGDNADAVGTFTVTAPANTAVDYAGTSDDILNKAVKLSTNQSVNANTGKITPNEVTTLQAGGTLIMAGDKILPKSQQFVVSGDDTTPPAQGDYNGVGQYTPDNGTGLYIFKRTIYSGDDNDKTEYSGYYYDGSSFYALKTKTTIDTTSSKTTPYIDFGDGGTGFTLNDNGEITGINGTISLLTQATYKTAGMGGNGADLATITTQFGTLTVADNAADTFAEKTNASEINAIKLVIKAPSTADASGTVIYIKLADDWNTYYDLVQPTGDADSIADWFYYKDTVKSGETTEKLVDYVRLANTVSTNDFVELTYDLNAVLNSVQVSYNNEGDETAAAVDTTTWATPALTTNPVDNNGSVSKITAVSWS